MVTLRTPKVWPRRAARWFRERVHAPFVSGVLADAESRRPQAAGVGLVLGVLIGLTTLAVAWVSVWWVPAYLVFMVFIFIMPHGHGQPDCVSESDQKSPVGISADLGQSLRVDHVSEEVHSHLASGSISGSMTDESAVDTGAPHLDLTNSGAARGRRTRSRARKSAKPAAEQMPESASVTWIRVGPGKFIRAEGGSEAVDQANDGEVSAYNHAVIIESDQDSTALWEPAHTLVAEDGSPESPATNCADRGGTFGSDDCVMDSTTEVYGIAPSTFGSIQSDAPSIEDVKPGIPEPGVTSDADCSPAPNVSNNLLAHGADRQTAHSRGSISGSRVHRFSRGIADTIRSGDRGSLRCNVRKGPKARLQIRSSSRPDGRLEQAMRRTFGRISHIERSLRPRSPPYSW
jgi:hypothetical protein